MTVTEHAVIGAESLRQGWVCNVPHAMLSGVLDSVLGLVQWYTPMSGKHIRVGSKPQLRCCEMGHLHCRGHVHFDMLVTTVEKFSLSLMMMTMYAAKTTKLTVMSGL